MASFVSTKAGGTIVVRRPLARWAERWARHLLSLVDHDDDVGQPFADRGAVSLEEVLKGLLRGSHWHDVRWHALRRGGATASYHRKAHVRFFMLWGRWRRLQIALGYATHCSDPEVVGPVVLLDLAYGNFVKILENCWSKMSGRQQCSPTSQSKLPTSSRSFGWLPPRGQRPSGQLQSPVGAVHLSHTPPHPPWHPPPRRPRRAATYMRVFLAVHSVPIAIYEGLFGSAKCPHRHISGAFWQCKVSPSPYMRVFLAVHSVPVAVYEGLFGSAKCPHRRI